LYLLDEFDVINSEQHFPIFVFSNFKNWNEFKHNYRKQILPRIDETLPKELSSFVEKLKKINNAKEKITKALSYIIHNYVYLGDWRPVRGSHIPRPLNEIVETKYGDCKDFSLLLTKILKEAGVEASMALIFRGTLPPYYSKIRQTPTLGAFNHMIVAVKNEDHFDYYDPTNMTVIVRSIAIDISQRYVLVLDEYSQNLFFTPKIDPEVNKLNLDIRIDEINFKSNLVDARAKYYINGPEAHYLLYSLLNNPLPVAEMRLRDRIFSGERIKDFKTLKFPKKQRILPKEGLEAIYSIEYTGPVIETTLGKGVIDVRSTGFARLPSPEDIKPDRINDLWLNVPLTNHRILRFPMNKIEGQLPEKCEAANSFFQRTREFTQTDNEILRMDTLVVTNPIVPNSILLSSKFIKDLEKADRCDDPVVLIPRK
ncbi:MAG: hypothetical protein KDD50_11760, partial [Bdellovibrionales bacterium]|nr:hypothetical protein [Bdellovibrionales bacterium]